MEKKDYIEYKEEAMRKIADAKAKLASVKEMYIESNSKFDVGQRVKVTTPAHNHQRCTMDGWIPGVTPESVEYAYVMGYEISYRDKVVPRLNKEKKDGTVSKLKCYYGTNPDRITLA